MIQARRLAAHFGYTSQELEIVLVGTVWPILCSLYCLIFWLDVICVFSRFSPVYTYPKEHDLLTL